MNLGCAIVINICALALFIALSRGIYHASKMLYNRFSSIESNSSNNVKIMFFLILSIAFIALFNINIFDVSLCVLFYSLFDVPSVLSAIVGLNYIAFVVRTLKCSFLSPINPINRGSHSLRDIESTHNIASTQSLPSIAPSLFNTKSAAIFVFFGAFIYAHILGYGLFDIYSNDVVIYALLLVLSIACYCVCVRVGIALLICILCYILQALDEISIVAYCIDPFLWAYCVVVFVGGLIIKYAFNKKF